MKKKVAEENPQLKDAGAGVCQRYILLHFLKPEMFSCLFVCLFVCLGDYYPGYQRVFFSVEVT